MNLSRPDRRRASTGSPPSTRSARCRPRARARLARVARGDATSPRRCANGRTRLAVAGRRRAGRHAAAAGLGAHRRAARTCGRRAAPRRPPRWWDRLGVLARAHARPASPRRWRSASRCTRSGRRPSAPIVVVLAGPDGKPALIASARRDDRFLMVKAVGRGAGRPGRRSSCGCCRRGSRRARSGVLPAGEMVRVPLPAPSDVALANIPALAVSLEPPAARPPACRPGPVLYSGKIERMY